MTTTRIVLACTLALAVTWSSPTAAQDRQPSGARQPQVDIVQTLGCAERRTGEMSEWWLTRALDPTVTRAGVFTRQQIEEAQNAGLGSNRFQLIGFADFLDAEGLLTSGDRAQFTTREQVNATGELRDGRTILVKGALIKTDAEPRINLLSVIGVSETCG